MKSLKTTILKEIQLAVEDTRSSDCDKLEDAVHSFRRRCKRIRAYLRLLPSSLSKQARRARRHTRLAAASLSKLRDAQVMDRILLQIHERLVKSSGQGPSVEKSSSVSQEKTKPSPCAASPVQDQLISAAKLLNKAKRVVSHLSNNQDKSSLFVNLQKTYSAARLATQLAANRACPEDFHELRKITKQFYHQCQFVASALDRELQTEIDHARIIADKLGNAQDLSVLTSNLINDLKKGDEPTVPAVIEESQRQMTTLFDESILLACRLYFESPKEFGRRIT